MRIHHEEILLQTKGEMEFIDLTEKINRIIEESRIGNGFINVQTLHTTCSLLLNENEPLLLEDFKKHLQQLSPKEAKYNHNDFSIRTVNMCQDECKNGHSHCLASHLPSNLTLNIIEGKLQLGQWQRIFAIELDKPRQRKIQIQIIGE